MNELSEPAPDAGASYLGHYGFSAWTVWVLNRASWLLSESPSKFQRNSNPPPVCPESPAFPTFDVHRMIPRPPFWKCYRHMRAREPIDVVLPMVLTLESAPRCAVLSRTGEMLDLVFDDGEWQLVAV